MTPSSRNKPTAGSGVPALSDATDSFSDLPGGERVYRILIGAIERGELKGGARLRELELAKQIGVSRTPVREALARLEEQGLVVNDGSRGVVVGQLDHRAITELYTMREVLEGTAARLAAQHASEVEITILRKIVERHEQLSDPLDQAENNKLFHGTLYRCSHNRYLLKMLRSIHEAMLLLGQTALATKVASAQWTKEHLALVEAIESHDGDAAEKLARSLISAAFSARLSQVIANMGNRFEINNP